MMYSHSPYRHPLAIALARIVGELVGHTATASPSIELIPMAPAAELKARAAAEKKAADEFRRRRHALRLRGG